MDEDQSHQPATDTADGAPTPTEVDAALQQAQRREAATSGGPASEDQVFDSANEVGMGQVADGGRYTGQGRDTAGAFGEETPENEEPKRDGDLGLPV